MFPGYGLPFPMQDWIEENQHLLKPPVANKLLFEGSNLVVQMVGGGNERVDFHDDPTQEFFYQLKGDMLLKVHDGSKIVDIPIREGDVFLLPEHVRHSPQRPQKGSIGLVVEGQRSPGMLDGFEWFCMRCGTMVSRVEVPVTHIVKDLPPLFDAFYGDVGRRTCKNCGDVHPGRTPPANWSII